MDIQVNNIDLIDLTASDLVLNNIGLTDGYNLLKIVATGAVTGTMLVFDTAVVDAFVISGTGIVNFDNVMFRKLSTLNGRYVLNNSVDNAVFTQLYSVATTAVAINNTGNKCVFEGQVLNAVKQLNDTSAGTYYNFYSNGSTVEHKVNIMVYLQDTEPTDVNEHTVWYDIMSTANIGDDVSIGNATTSNNEPNTPYWFDPVE
jgi:hypothetical protein